MVYIFTHSPTANMSAVFWEDQSIVKMRPVASAFGLQEKIMGKIKKDHNRDPTNKMYYRN